MKSITQKPKQSYYFKLHNKLGKKYRTENNHFSSPKVGFIRTCYFKWGLNKQQTIEKAENFAFKPHNKRTHHIMWYLHIATFLKKASDEVWEDLTQDFIWKQKKD